MALSANQMTTGEVRLSYAHLDKPYAHDPKGTPKYSVTILMPKTDTASKARLDAAYQAAVQKGITDKWNGVQPPQIACPIYDGDGVRPNGDPFGPECRGHWVFTANSTNPVPLIDEAQNPIIQPSEIYSGCYARVCVSLFAYSNTGKRGIGVGLEAVQKLRDGEPLGGGVSLADAFGAPAATAPAQPVAPAPYPQPPAQPYSAPAPAAPAQAYPAPTMQQPNGSVYDPITGTYGWGG